MDSRNHYEAAFKAYLQWNGHCFVAVNEGDRPQLGDETLKNLDFIVHGEAGRRLLVDIKGRRYPTGAPGRQRRVWECWSTLDDVNGLERWAELFGPGSRGLIVFAYEVLPEIPLFADTEDLWSWRDRRYLFRAVAAEDYRRYMKVRSPKWGTVTLPRAAFRDLVRPFRHFTQADNRQARLFI
jgi:hypothetical protein